ncbi:hypothetical protein AQZ52_04600 [Novosphingobium fuchskuhlense]|uniref:DUF6671 domain-containing protein n=1 Tax=Novosphingobium fuchskuhlense TaxID=1117702 RepID=A0A124JVQ6_9SPHN|nr:DUF6671 family protein [Novosphingobium fuchskuhlense]KUR72527.1 hypothetical protein AQZ52_04600 [Novosphingobium fuchskuhlense]
MAVLPPPWGDLCNGAQAILATMHGKERAIAPLAGRFLGLDVAVATGLDTDAFGTFSREIERAGTPRDAARAKIAAAFRLHPEARVGIASEGSFGPHPGLPFAALDRELVLLIDRASGRELIGHHATMATNFAHRTVADIEAGLAFAARAGFPAHGVIVMGVSDGKPAPQLGLFKAIDTEASLSTALGRILALTGEAHIETDMRAHRNPRRMRAIRRAMLDLVRRSRSLCPICAWPGFAITKRAAGLPCAWCASPTPQTRAEVWTCEGCGYTEERPVRAATADPMHCEACNP